MSSAGTCIDRSRGKRCRKVREHVVHALHLDDCPVPLEDHHAFVQSGLRPAGDGTLSSDPFVLTSFAIRRSDRAYMETRYGRLGAKLREWIADDRGLTGVRRKRHLARGDPGRPYDKDGNFVARKTLLQEIELIEAIVGAPMNAPIPGRTPAGGAQQTVDLLQKLPTGSYQPPTDNRQPPPAPEPPAPLGTVENGTQSLRDHATFPAGFPVTAEEVSPLGDDLDLLERLGRGE